MSSAVDHPVVPGDFVTLTAADGDVVLGRLLSKDVVEADGPSVSVNGLRSDSEDGTDTPSVQVAMRLRIARGEGEVVGVVDAGSVILGTSSPFDEALLEVAPVSMVAQLLEQVDAGRPTAVVGAVPVSDTQVLPATLRLSGFNRHTFVCGQSGSGKTFSLGVILERLVVQTSLRVVVLDPNGDFVRITELQSAAEVDATRSVTPPSDEDASFRAAHAAAVPGIAVHSVSTGRPATARLLEMSPQAQAAVLRLDPIADRAEYSDAVALLGRLREARARGAALGVSHAEAEAALASLEHEAGAVSPDLALRLRNLGLLQWSVWARDQSSVVDSIRTGARVTVADLGSLPTDAERDVLALSVLEHLWDHRAERIPTLIVIDEAHTVVPRVANGPVSELARDLVVRIAGEGRKFGLFLVLATQRPDKVHPSALTQCDNLMLMRMNARSDVADLERSFSFVPADLIRQSLTFRQGEAVLAGPFVHGPTRLRFGGRYTVEGGSDLPTDWANVGTP
jgi:hypothetical protein